MNHWKSRECTDRWQVAWLDQNFFPLTYEQETVIDDPRFSVVRPYLKEWNLLISDVRSGDRGSYRCTVNTNPVRSKITTLHVKGRRRRSAVEYKIYTTFHRNLTSACLHCVSKKTIHLTFDHHFGKCRHNMMTVAVSKVGVVLCRE